MCGWHTGSRKKEQNEVCSSVEEKETRACLYTCLACAERCVLHAKPDRFFLLELNSLEDWRQSWAFVLLEDIGDCSNITLKHEIGVKHEMQESTCLDLFFCIWKYCLLTEMVIIISLLVNILYFLGSIKKNRFERLQKENLKGTWLDKICNHNVFRVSWKCIWGC